MKRRSIFLCPTCIFSLKFSQYIYTGFHCTCPDSEHFLDNFSSDHIIVNGRSLRTLHKCNCYNQPALFDSRDFNKIYL